MCVDTDDNTILSLCPCVCERVCEEMTCMDGSMDRWIDVYECEGEEEDQNDM